MEPGPDAIRRGAGAARSCAPAPRRHASRPATEDAARAARPRRAERTRRRGDRGRSLRRRARSARRAGSTGETEQARHREPAKPANRVGRREAHRAHFGAIALTVAAPEGVIAQKDAPARFASVVAVVELERQRAVEGSWSGEALVVPDHRARRDAHAAADALDRQIDLAPLRGEPRHTGVVLGLVA